MEIHLYVCTTLNMIYYVTIWNYEKLYLLVVYLISYRQMLTWLFEYYRTLTTLLSKIIKHCVNPSSK